MGFLNELFTPAVIAILIANIMAMLICFYAFDMDINSSSKVSSISIILYIFVEGVLLMIEENRKQRKAMMQPQATS